jgi:hypothetical protein
MMMRRTKGQRIFGYSSPVKLFEDKDRYCNNVSDPNAGINDPDNEFLSSLNSTRFVRRPSSDISGPNEGDRGRMSRLSFVTV